MHLLSKSFSAKARTDFMVYKKFFWKTIINTHTRKNSCQIYKIILSMRYILSGKRMLNVLLIKGYWGIG